jgi:hypothetical protein
VREWVGDRLPVDMESVPTAKPLANISGTAAKVDSPCWEPPISSLLNCWC